MWDIISSNVPSSEYPFSIIKSVFSNSWEFSTFSTNILEPKLEIFDVDFQGEEQLERSSPLLLISLLGMIAM